MVARTKAATIGKTQGEDDKRGRILHAAMDTFREHGFAAATTLEIATRARVSKRELYALVGNKEEMLATCIAERGRRMRLPADFPQPRDRATLEAALRAFGATMLREITDPGVLEVMRLGIAEARRSPGVAQSIESMGRAPAAAALEALLKPGRRAGLLTSDDYARMKGVFYGLLWGDLLVWILLGLEKVPAGKEVEKRAATVAHAFLDIYGRT